VRKKAARCAASFSFSRMLRATAEGCLAAD
jgi:hypothetical protein